MLRAMHKEHADRTGRTEQLYICPRLDVSHHVLLAPSPRIPARSGGSQPIKVPHNYRHNFVENNFRETPLSGGTLE